MTIDKVINNNQVICIDKNRQECVVLGTGIGFKARVGQNVPEEKIEKIFRLESPGVSSKFQQLIAKIPMKHIQVSDEIISYIKCSLGEKLDDNIYISLTDHINFAIERYQKGIELSNGLLWEIRRFYPQEFELGKYAISYMEEKLGIPFQEDEAGFIALHIVNAKMNVGMDQTMIMTRMIQGVLNLVKYYFRIEFQEDSLDYGRFLTHLRFFAQRLVRGKLYTTEDPVFCEMIKNQYAEEYACVEKIREYIKIEFEHEMTEEEMMYLTVHIKRLVKQDQG